MRKLKLVAIVTVIALALIVVFQNTETVNTHLLFVEVAMPRAALLAITLVLGFALGMVASLLIGRGKPKAGK